MSKKSFIFLFALGLSSLSFAAEFNCSSSVDEQGRFYKITSFPEAGWIGQKEEISLNLVNASTGVVYANQSKQFEVFRADISSNIVKIAAIYMLNTPARSGLSQKFDAIDIEVNPVSKSGYLRMTTSYNASLQIIQFRCQSVLTE
jgi:hypothetical protein